MVNCCALCPQFANVIVHFSDIPVCQIDQLFKSSIIWKYIFGLGDLSDLAIVTFYDVGRINDMSDGCGILKIPSYLGSNNIVVFLTI